MTATAWCLLALTAVAVALVALALADDRRPDGHVPRHGRWIQDGETTRLSVPDQASARAGVLQPSEKLLLGQEGEELWRFPPFPGER